MHEKVALKRQRSGELTVDRRASNTTGSGLVNNTCTQRAVVTEYLDRNVLNTAELPQMNPRAMSRRLVVVLRVKRSISVIN